MAMKHIFSFWLKDRTAGRRLSTTDVEEKFALGSCVYE